MATLTQTITGDTASALSLVSLTDANSGLAIAVAPTLPQPFTSGGAGVWTYSFAEPAAGLTYRYTCLITWPDGGTSQIDGLLAGTAQAASRYASQADVQDQFGIDNVAVWSDLDNQQNPPANVSRIQIALNYACDQIDNFFRGGPYAVPLVLNSAQSTLTHWAAGIAGVWLYDNRGQRDQGADGGRYQTLLAGIHTDMRRFKTGLTARLDAAAAFTASPWPRMPVV